MTHLNEQTIQAFLDGELSEKLAAAATQHLAICDACSNNLLVAEAEMAEIDLAFMAEKNSPCPTQRIWARIENEIDVCAWQQKPEKCQPKTVWQTCAEFFTPAQVAFASGLAAVVLISFVSLGFLEQHLEETQTQVATVEQVSESKVADLISFPDAPQINQIGDNEPAKSATAANSALRIVKDDSKIARANRSAILRVKSAKSSKPNFAAPLAEEKDYLNSIAALSKTVGTPDEIEMQPSVRVEYERNLAMTNRAIADLQKQVRKNPADENAKRILFASYQNKIELLNAVSEKTQLVASLQ